VGLFLVFLVAVAALAFAISESFFWSKRLFCFVCVLCKRENLRVMKYVKKYLNFNLDLLWRDGCGSRRGI
jgi:hypothetical protein